MKSRVLIIIGIVVALGSLTTILAMNFLDDEKTTVSDTSPKQLEAILEYCIDSKVLVDTVGLSYYNNTHFIDTITCEWQKHDWVEIDSEGFDVNWRGDEDYCSEWCDQNELYQLGCDKPILAHLTKHSNLLDEEFDGKYAIEDEGLPDGVSKEKFEECVDFILEKRTKSLENTEPEPEVEPDTGEFRYGKQECHYTDANGEQNFCVVEGWTKPVSELDCEEICKPPSSSKGIENEK